MKLRTLVGRHRSGRLQDASRSGPIRQPSDLGAAFNVGGGSCPQPRRSGVRLSHHSPRATCMTKANQNASPKVAWSGSASPSGPPVAADGEGCEQAGPDPDGSDADADGERPRIIHRRCWGTSSRRIARNARTRQVTNQAPKTREALASIAPPQEWSGPKTSARGRHSATHTTGAPGPVAGAQCSASCGSGVRAAAGHRAGRPRQEQCAGRRATDARRTAGRSRRQGPCRPECAASR